VKLKLNILGKILLTALCLYTSCDSSGSGFGPPDDVRAAPRVPAELNDDVEFWAAASERPAIADLADLPLERRRGHMFFLTQDGLQRFPADLEPRTLSVYARRSGANNTTAINAVALKLGMVADGPVELSLGVDLYTLEAPTDLTAGELAWYADWILINYPDDFFFADLTFNQIVYPAG
jgi:hypothetical protein